MCKSCHGSRPAHLPRTGVWELLPAMGGDVGTQTPHGHGRELTRAPPPFHSCSSTTMCYAIAGAIAGAIPCVAMWFFPPPCLIPSLTHQSFTLSHVPVGIPECCPAVGTGGQGDPELGLLPTEISAMGRAMVPSAHPSHCCAQGTAQGLCSAPP